MYTLLMILLIGIGIWLAVLGARKRRFVMVAAGILMAAGTAFFFWFMGFWAERLWFEALGYSDRFWAVVMVRVLAGAIGGAVGAGVVWALTLGYTAAKRPIRLMAVVLAAAAGATWGLSVWETVLQYLNAAPTELKDPVFQLPVGFYLFRLPMADAAVTLMTMLAVIAVAACALDAFVNLRGDPQVAVDVQVEASRIASVYRAAGVFLLVLALDKYLARYHLLFSEWGAVTGPGWTDVTVRLPALAVTVGAMALAAALLLIPPLHRRLTTRLGRRFDSALHLHGTVLGGIAAAVWAIHILLLSAVPAMFQSLRVEPNEITFEKPYIANNIRMTRHGFGLHAVEEREYPAAGAFSAATVAANQAIFENIRLWDWRALDAVYKQFQEIRLYYEFADVDVDRYTIDGNYRQVMVSAREMEPDNLPEQSQTFVNRRFKYTHGYGITMTNVSDFTPQGLPDLLIRDIPPVSRHPSLTVDRPEIYYGELTRTPVIVNTREAEFDYPQGDTNATIRYPGEGGVPLANLWRKFLYGWKFDGLQLFLSGYPTRASRIMFHRQIEARVQRVAPFLTFDDDPYIVLADGRLQWIIDAYTTSSFFPYSAPFEPGAAAGADDPGLAPFRGRNYVRNAVKAVVDAFDGSVDFYVFDDTDPIIRTWRRIFPGLFKDASAMPAALRDHVRYPADMLLLQGLMYAKYHMTDPAVFYNQEDLWVRATEKYYDQVQPVAPYYIMWELPASDHPEFVLMLPFTPKNRQVSIGWIAGMCDGENYGRFLAYQFPKEKRILGPQQVETKIDQDRFLSGQLTLWDQRGSRVIRGNVLAIPVADTLLYVEPIYLQAETAAYPELRLVALMHDDTLSYAESFDEALQGLLGQTAGIPTTAGADTAQRLTTTQWVRRAGEAFDEVLQALGEKRFEDAADALQRLESALGELSANAAEDAPSTSGGAPTAATE